MATIIYNGKKHEAKLDNGKLLELEDRGFSVLNVAELSKNKPLRFYTELLKAALDLPEEMTAAEVANGLESFDALNKAAAELLKDVFPAVPTQAATPKAAKKK